MFSFFRKKSKTSDDVVEVADAAASSVAPAQVATSQVSAPELPSAPVAQPGSDQGVAVPGALPTPPAQPTPSEPSEPSTPSAMPGTASAEASAAAQVRGAGPLRSASPFGAGAPRVIGQAATLPAAARPSDADAPPGPAAPVARSHDASGPEPSLVSAPAPTPTLAPTPTPTPPETVVPPESAPATVPAAAPRVPVSAPSSVAAPAAASSAASAAAARTASPAVGGIPAERPGAGARASLMPQAAEPTTAAAPEKKSWLARLKSGLSRTGQNFTGLFVNVKVDENLFEELETALIMADAGVEATESLLTALRARVRKERIEDGAQVKAVLHELLTEHLKPLQQGFDLDRAKPLVVMIAGVNGAGKTTSIGKLARAFQASGRSVLLAAGDTFRAAAREQLVEWGRRNQVAVVAQADGGDPAAVAFDAVQAGRARGMGVVMIDTAGRLATQLHLMAELQKVRKVINKAEPEAPHEVLLVVDGNTGQNALAQIKAFDQALGLTGLVVTKLDGTARGGILAAVAAGSQGVRPVPVYWIGVGEGIEDLQPFVASEFATAMLGT